MPTNSDRYAIGNRYYSPKPPRRSYHLGRWVALVVLVLAVALIFTTGF